MILPVQRIDEDWTTPLSPTLKPNAFIYLSVRFGRVVFFCNKLRGMFRRSPRPRTQQTGGAAPVAWSRGDVLCRFTSGGGSGCKRCSWSCCGVVADDQKQRTSGTVDEGTCSGGRPPQMVSFALLLAYLWRATRTRTVSYVFPRFCIHS